MVAVAVAGVMVMLESLTVLLIVVLAGGLGIVFLLHVHVRRRGRFIWHSRVSWDAWPVTLVVIVMPLLRSLADTALESMLLIVVLTSKLGIIILLRGVHLRL